MTADEKVEELQVIVDEREKTIAELKNQVKESIRPQELRERVETIVQKEVEARVRQLNVGGGDSGGSSFIGDQSNPKLA